MSRQQVAPGTDTSGPICPMCGGSAHVTKKSYLACSQDRRKEFAELSALVKQATTKKPKGAS